MLIELPILWIVILNVAGWVVIQLGLAWVFTQLPAEWFKPPATATWEVQGRWYERVFLVKRWKSLLPDGAGWFTGGFAKRSLDRRDRQHLERFRRETWRGELCHWAAMACAPFFFLWNPWWGDVIILAYAVIANLPCILVQRYNRARLHRVLRRH